MTGDKTPQAFQQLLEIMAALRSTQGCSWDRQQTPESLKPYILEECYELLEAIDHARPQEICDELGDLLLQVVFLAQIFSEQGDFTMDNVATTISQKLIRRHPHIFARDSAEGHEQCWETIKLQERKERGQPINLAERIPKTLPALKRAQKIAKKLSPKASYEVIAEIDNELNRLKSLVNSTGESADKRHGITGALLFNIVRLANVCGTDAEESLRRINGEIVAKIDANK
jgi:nucleoside triphosphate diphosphatase